MVGENKAAAEKFIEKHLAFFRDTIYHDAMEVTGTRWMLDDFCREMRSTYTILQRADLSNILQGWAPFVRNGIFAPLGMGHEMDYFSNPRTRKAMRCTEAFAEFSSAYIVDHDSLAVLQKYLPKTSKAYLRLCEEASKR